MEDDRIQEEERVEGRNETVGESFSEVLSLVVFKLRPNNPLDFTEYVISLYELHRRLKANNDIRSLRPMLVRILSVYVLYGISKETKIAALRSVGIKNDNRINMLNKELRDLGFIEKHYDANNNLDFLNPELTSISKYLRKIFNDGVKEEMKRKGIRYNDISMRIELL